MAGARALTDDEMVKVLNQFDNPRDRCMFLLECKGGPRLSECLDLRIKDVVKDGRVVETLYLPKSMRKGGKGPGGGATKGGVRSQDIPLHKDVRAAINLLLGTMPSTLPDQYLIATPRGRMHRTTWHKILAQAFKAAGVTGRVSSHSCRKRFARHVYNGTGHDLLATRDALGHTSIRNTERYLTVDKPSMVKAILSD